MTQPGLATTPEYIANASADCNNTAADIDARLAELKTFVMSLEEVWHGMASGSFNNLMTDYDVYGRMLHDALVDIGSGLQGNFVNYTQTETANINSLVAVNGEIPGSNSSVPSPNF